MTVVSTRSMKVADSVTTNAAHRLGLNPSVALGEAEADDMGRPLRERPEAHVSGIVDEPREGLL